LGLFYENYIEGFKNEVELIFTIQISLEWGNAKLDYIF